jgi:beta-amylase
MDPAAATAAEDAAFSKPKPKQVSWLPLPLLWLCVPSLRSSMSHCCVGLLLQVPEVAPRPPERDFAGTPYIPVYVMLPVRTHLLHFLMLDLRDRVSIHVRVFVSLGW